MDQVSSITRCVVGWSSLLHCLNQSGAITITRIIPWNQVWSDEISQNFIYRGARVNGSVSKCPCFIWVRIYAIKLNEYLLFLIDNNLTMYIRIIFDFYEYCGLEWRRCSLWVHAKYLVVWEFRFIIVARRKFIGISNKFYTLDICTQNQNQLSSATGRLVSLSIFSHSISNYHLIGYLVLVNANKHEMNKCYAHRQVTEKAMQNLRELIKCQKDCRWNLSANVLRCIIKHSSYRSNIFGFCFK